jgi:hypothetical protein
VKLSLIRRLLQPDGPLTQLIAVKYSFADKLGQISKALQAA